MAFPTEDDDDNTAKTLKSAGTSERVIDTTKRNPLTGSLEFSEKIKLMTLLEQWEEPERHDEGRVSLIPTVH